MTSEMISFSTNLNSKSIGVEHISGIALDCFTRRATQGVSPCSINSAHATYDFILESIIMLTLFIITIFGVLKAVVSQERHHEVQHATSKTHTLISDKFHGEVHDVKDHDFGVIQTAVVNDEYGDEYHDIVVNHGVVHHSPPPPPESVMLTTTSLMLSFTTKGYRVPRKEPKRVDIPKYGGIYH